MVNQTNTDERNRTAMKEPQRVDYRNEQEYQDAMRFYSYKKQTQRKWLSKTDKDFLFFIYNRLIAVHGENPDVDYMIRFASIIEYFHID